ncbi:MAG TPA: HDIG domain-containing protein [Thermoanaerobaculia bacterium]|nr:HDIG domain-containing protein [Thermoanaerobaculia bacterium]HUM28942.1 HDIG domain-containing protein [Thermoanaerobaculia bacterium]HXK67126.1 HDIG domain-containing protein [Thermoanaerobaculia bacterium]
MSEVPSREEALSLLKEYTTSDRLIIHALAVESAMRAYAKKFGEDEEYWGIIGLIHDFDYERFPTPETHVHEGMKILQERNYPEEMIRAIASHADYMGIPRATSLQKTLYAVDELSGFILAAALVRPSKKLADLSVKSVKKRFKDKAFARSVDRDAIFRGAEELGIPIEDHIAYVIEAMLPISDELGV